MWSIVGKMRSLVVTSILGKIKLVSLYYSIEGGRLIARITSYHMTCIMIKKTSWNKRRNFDIKINILEFLARIHFQL